MTEALAFFSGELWAAWVYRDHVHTILYDGSETRGYPLDTDKFTEDAAKAGYLYRGVSDTYWFMIEHDLLHSWLAERIDNAPSASLWNQAHDKDAWLKSAPPPVKRDEERVYAVQAAMNGVIWAKKRLDELQVPYTHVLDAVSRFRFPCVMTSRFAREHRPNRILPKYWEGTEATTGEDHGEERK